MIARIPPVETVSAVGYVPGVTVRRTAAVPAVDSGGISVLATQTSLLRTLGGMVARGTFLNAATIHYPPWCSARSPPGRWASTRVTPGTLVYLGGQYFSVVGILRPVPLAPEIDEAALVGFPVADALLGLGGHATEIYLRSQPDQVQAVARCCRSPPTRPCPRASRSASRPRCSPRGHRRGPALTGLFLALGGVAVGSAGSASPTSW